MQIALNHAALVKWTVHKIKTRSMGNHKAVMGWVVAILYIRLHVFYRFTTTAHDLRLSWT